MNGRLTTALQAMQTRQYRKALERLLHQWRGHPTAALAERIEHFSNWLSATVVSIDADDPLAWMRRASLENPVDQPMLAACLPQADPAVVNARLDWLSNQPADPRWTSTLVDLAQAHWVARTRTHGQICRRALKTLMHGRDARAVVAFDAAKFSGRDYWRVPAATWRDRLTDACAPAESVPDLSAWDALVAALPAHPPTHSDAVQGRARRTEAELLALIYATPDDLDVRRIYADLLEQRGAPRAEFIRLQMQHLDGQVTRQTARAEAALLARHATRWLGPLAPHVTDVDWRCGFPAATTIELGDDLDVLDAPEWSTLTAAYALDPRIVMHPHLAGVRQLGRSCGFLEKTRAPVAMHAVTLDAVVDRPIERLVIAPIALKRLNPTQWPELATLEIAPDPREQATRPHRIADWPMRTLRIWQARPDTIEPYLTIARVQRFEFMLAAGTLRLGIERRAGGWHLDVVWLGAMRCRSLDPAPALAQRVNAQSVQIHTPFYRHSAAQLATWQDLFAGVVELPVARGTDRQRL